LLSSLRCSGTRFELKRELAVRFAVLELAVELEVSQFDVGKDEGVSEKWLGVRSI
jgi:hypothetical protein